MLQFRFLLLVEGSDRDEDWPRRSLMRATLGLRLRLVFLLKHEDARVGLTGYFGQHQQVVATEALCGFPLFAVLVEAGEGNRVPGAAFGFVRPNRGLDATDADFSDGFRVRFPPKKLRVCERFRPQLAETSQP